MVKTTIISSRGALSAKLMILRSREVRGKIFLERGANPKALRKDAISREYSCMFVVGVVA